MKLLARVVAAVAAIAGSALLVWILYDATEVWRRLGLQSQVDEATVAVVGLVIASFMLMSGVVSWRRARA